MKVQEKQRLEDVATGRLIKKADVEQQMADLAAVVMNGLKALPVRVANRLVNMTSEHEIRLLLIDEVNEIITAIRQECNAPDESDDEPMMDER